MEQTGRGEKAGTGKGEIVGETCQWIFLKRERERTGAIPALRHWSVMASSGLRRPEPLTFVMDRMCRRLSWGSP